MDIVEKIVSILAGLVAVLATIFQVVKWYKKRRKPRTKVKKRKLKATAQAIQLSKKNTAEINSIIKIAYTMLRLEQLPNTGNWGFTINILNLIILMIKKY